MFDSQSFKRRFDYLEELVWLLLGRGSSSSRFAFIIEPSIAALEAVAVGGLQNGQPANVQSNGSEWELTAKGTLTIDHITVASSPDPTRVWQRTGSFIIEAAQAQTAWHVALPGAPIAGNDENTGLDAAHPIKTKAEIFRRWGYTWEAELDGIDVVVTYTGNDDGSGHDPALFAPKFVNAATFTQTAALGAPVFTGTLLAVTAKNVTGNTALSSTFTTTTGSMGIGTLLINTTRGNSVAWASASPAEGVFLLSQPLDPTTFAEVNTWANGDAVQGFALTQVDIAVIGGTVIGFPLAVISSHLIENIRIQDPQGFGTPVEINLSCAPQLFNCACNRFATFDGPGNTSGAVFANVAFDGLVFGEANSFNGVSMLGGYFSGGAIANGIVIKNDTLILDSMSFGQASLGSIYIDTGVTVTFVQGPIISASASTLRIYGPGSINILNSALIYTSPAATNLPIGGGMTIGGQGNAYTITAGGGTHVVALTAANLDAAAGAAGFGGLASIPGVGSVWNGSTP